ncbi:NAD-dependent deacylase [Gottfriedia acidiceleris]|uniref:protein acetyllysine N-acetyltransferase n=2 Tax=Gottfriedia acidiceleris TaxID=371036 RepID=A0ABY4JRI7_9BACI|nr:NAD-dependent deacylase [Gottfriedia acidiceleris]UPM56475.1 NAD-dependent deacylase [Gottfriedia acidiceleris]
MKNSLNEVEGLDPACEKLLNFIKQSDYTLVLTGAGLSVSSGLPDFRSSKTGLWRNKNPMTLASLNALENNRNEFIEFYTERIKTLQGVLPNVAHKILSKWEKKCLLNSVISQNVDSLHQAAGSENVIELHGTLSNCYCNQCNTEYGSQKFLNKDYECSCGGFIRPSVVLFGEDLPFKAIENAIKETSRAKLFIVLGSSLSVAPANYFPKEAKKNGARLVIINKEPTELDNIADLVIQRPISEVLIKIDSALQP